MIRAARLVHPFPSLLNATLVVAIASVAGAPAERGLLLGLAMLLLQFCIGTVNDIFDVQLDAESKPWKPIPSRVVSKRAAQILGSAMGLGSLAIAGTFGPAVLVMATAMLTAGFLYDAALKRTRYAWVCFSIAFPILPIYAWYGATGVMPPRWELLVPVAILAGPALQLANGLVDLTSDAAAGLRTLATTLGLRASLAVIAILLLIIHTTAWLTLAPGASGIVLGLAYAASLTAVAGFVLSSRSAPSRRALGWTAQAVSIALLGAAWIAAAAEAA